MGVLQEDTSLSKVHTLFRMLGLRHIAVIPRANSVLGVITRHDLLPEALEDTFMGQQAPLGAGGSICVNKRIATCCKQYLTLTHKYSVLGA